MGCLLHRPTVSPLIIPLLYCHINRFRRASHLARPSQGGEKRIAMGASHQEALCSDGVRAPPVCDHMVIPHGEVVLDGCNASGSAGAPAVTLPHGRHGLRARRMAVLET